MKINGQSARPACVIFAGGEGRRIGGRKPVRFLGSERLIDRALQQANWWSDLVAISVRDIAQVQPVDATLLVDSSGIEGPLAGLKSGLGFARDHQRRLLLTIPADTPFLPDDLHQRLRAGLGDRACVLASCRGRVHPLCALWRSSAFHDVEAYLATGKRSVVGFAELIGCETVSWEAGGRDPFFNINTAADLDHAQSMSGEERGYDIPTAAMSDVPVDRSDI